MKRLALAALLLLQDDVGSLVKQLDAAKREEIFRAMDRLVEKGPSAVDEIEKAAAGLSDAGRIYAGAVVREIRAVAALGERCPAPRRAALKVEKKPASDVLKQILDTFGGEVDSSNAFRGADVPDVTLDLADCTFFDALFALCVEAQLQLYVTNGKYRVYRGGVAAIPRSVFRGWAASLTNLRDSAIIDFSGAKRREFTPTIQALWDPALKIVDTGGGVTIFRAADDAGADLLKDRPAVRKPPEDKDVLSNLASQTNYVYCDPLRPLSEGAKKLAILTGSAKVRFAGKTDSATIENPLEAKELSREVGPFTIAVRRIERGNPHKVVVAVEAKEGGVEAVRAAVFEFSLTLKSGEARATGSGRVEEGRRVVYTLRVRPERSGGIVRVLGGGDDDFPDPDVPEPEPITAFKAVAHTGLIEKEMFFEFRDVAIEP